MVPHEDDILLRKGRLKNVILIWSYDRKWNCTCNVISSACSLICVVIKLQIKTATWVVSTFLSRFYDAKSRGHSFSFEELWDLTREDFDIAKKCKGGKWLDPNIFS